MQDIRPTLRGVEVGKQSIIFLQCGDHNSLVRRAKVGFKPMFALL
jgi:hypothetical protein